MFCKVVTLRSCITKMHISINTKIQYTLVVNKTNIIKLIEQRFGKRASVRIFHTLMTSNLEKDFFCRRCRSLQHTPVRICHDRHIHTYLALLRKVHMRSSTLARWSKIRVYMSEIHFDNVSYG